MKVTFGRIRTVAVALVVLGVSLEPVAAAPAADGTIQVPAFPLPLSNLLSAQTQALLKRQAEEKGESRRLCSLGDFSVPSIRAARECYDKNSSMPLVARHRARYAVDIAPKTLGGVPTEIITPAEGVPAANAQRVLINVHGGGFILGARWVGQMESIPVAGVGKFKVVSVDYRMAPEHRFPAASEDVAAVYRELLETYEARNIGIYGCSAGGVLTAQAVAWLQREGLPAPGAVGMFCGAASYWGEGDSGHFASGVLGIPIDRLAVPDNNPYLEDTVPTDPLVFPARHDRVLAKFPPSLLIASSRDQALSSVVHTHSRLVALGVEAQLHVWEGLGHAFFFDSDFPESREVYNVTVKFFDRYLGQEPAGARPEEPGLEERLRPEIERFAKADEAAPPAPCQVLFVGSSSIVRWESLAADMAPLPVINRGFGGSHIEHVNLWFDQTVAPYHPRAIVFYAGENDIAAGKSVDRVVADFNEFMVRKTAALGQTPVYFIAIKPSKLRLWQLKAQSQVNDKFRALAKRRSDLHYIDVVNPMLQDGQPKDLFVADALHMNREGYAIWRAALRATVLPKAQADEQRCRKHNTAMTAR